MRIEQLTVKDVLRFKGEMTLDLRPLGEGVFALVGPNGAGKTSWLEVVPGTLWRKLPSRRDGADPAVFARSREAALDVVFSIDGQGTFHARVSIDGHSRSSDAVLEHLQADGTWRPLNDGKVTTYRKVIADRLPSVELFLTSAFAAQGKGDRLARMTSGEGQQLFAEFLGLERYAAMAKTAREAAARLDAARGRLVATRDELRRDTSADVVARMDAAAEQLRADGTQATADQVELAALLQRLEARLVTVQDKVSAYTAASERARTIEAELSVRRVERAKVDDDRAAVAATLAMESTKITMRRDVDIAAAVDAIARAERALAGELEAIVAKRDAVIEDAAAKIAGNQKIQANAADIRNAVAALPGVEAQIATARAALEEAEVERTRCADELFRTEKSLANLKPIEDRLARATGDAALLTTVPCHGEGAYAACQLLLNAQTAKATIGDLETSLRPKAELADRIAGLARERDTLERRILDARTIVAEADAQRVRYEKHARFEPALNQSTERITELEGLQASVRGEAEQQAAAARERCATRTRELAASQAKSAADADAQLVEATQRHDARLGELRHAAERLDAAIARLASDLERARSDLDTAADGNQQAAALLADQAQARAAWDRVTATLARVEAGRVELERLRQGLAAKRARLADTEAKLATIEGRLLNFTTLAKVFHRDGLPAIEMDAVTPEIVATCNAIVGHTFGPRFTVDIVTQVERADGKGLKDEFRIQVMDNDEGGDWRDLSDLSGGEKVIVCEALMNAIAITVNARSSMPIRTLWRDETGAALHKDVAPLYVEMLRKVRELAGVHQIFFVTHNDEAAAMADAQIRVEAGRASIVLPPYSEAA